jgi:hypothetical protein
VSRWAWALAGVLATLLVSPSPAGAYSFGSTLTSDGTFDVVYDYDWDGARVNSCAQWHVPDEPARAYRDSNGNVQLTLASSFFNARMLGTTLDDVEPEQVASQLGGRPCASANTHPSGYNSDAAQHHDAEWILSTYRDAATNVVHALVHNEYNGSRYYPAYCSGSWPSAANLCMDMELTYLRSTDDGASFSHAGVEPPGNLIVDLPYRYVNDWGYAGMLSLLTDVVHNPRDGYYYAVGQTLAQPSSNFPAPTAPTTAESRGYLGAQKLGLCVIRTQTLGIPASWRAWDGDASDDAQNGFTVRFMDPYIETSEDPADHACEPIGALGGPPNTFLPSGLTFNTFFDKWMIVGTSWAPRSNPTTIGVFYSLSDDLVHWSDPLLLMQMKTAFFYKAAGCTGDLPVDYPVILDPNDSSTNFERPDDTAELYMTRFNNFTSDCVPLADRDLVRVSVQFHRPLRWATGGGEDCGGGFDEYNGSGTFAVDGSHNYSGASTAYQASIPAGSAGAYGTFTRDSYPPEGACSETNRPGFRFPSGGDVRYSGAFRFAGRPSGELTFMRLANRSSGGQSASALSLLPSGRVVFETDSSGAAGDETSLLQNPNGIQLPDDGCWHFFEVHQKLGTGATALNELWIDGQRADTVAATNFRGASYDRIDAGVVAGPGPYTLFTDMVGFAYPSGPLWYFGCRGAG